MDVTRLRHPVHDAVVELLGPRPGDVMVDLGTGLGATLDAAGQACPQVRRIGIDADASRLAEVRDVLPVRADLERPLPLADASVDLIACHNVFEQLTDPAEVLRQAARTLRPGGRAVWGHTDFAGLVIEGADPAMTRKVLTAYATVPEAGAHLAPDAADTLPALVAASPLTVDSTTTHDVTATTFESPWTQRVDEIAMVTLRLAAAGAADLTIDEVQAWWEDLVTAESTGLFRFVESAVLVLSHRCSR